MSNKTKAVLVIFDNYPTESIESPHLNQLIKDGNSHLLAFRNQSVSSPLERFNAFTSLSQLEGHFDSHQSQSGVEQSIIEQNFFKIGSDSKFSDMFHNGGIPDSTVITQNKDILAQAQKYGIHTVDTVLDIQVLEEALSKNTLVITYFENASSQQIDAVCQFLKKRDSDLLSYVTFFPVPIRKSHLLPPNKNPLLDDIIPKQTYLHFSSYMLDLEKDISHDQAALVIEHDQDYMRIDRFESHEEIIKTLQEDDRNHFIYKYSLCDSFIKAVAFKIGKLEKFGA